MESVRSATVSAWSSVASPLSSLGQWRNEPGPLPSGEMPRRFLRHADEHSVIACRAVLEAIASRPTVSLAAGERESGPPAGADWGVLAASSGAGRLMGAASLVATRSAGSAGVSTHVVPQCSLHAAASSISVILGLHGPHFGIGGGPEAFGEAIVVAASMIDLVSPDAGLWLVLTGWDREPVLDDNGAMLESEGDPVLRAIALALTRRPDGLARLEVGRARGPASSDAAVDCDGGSTPLTLAALVAAVESATAGASVALSLGGRMAAVVRPVGDHAPAREPGR